MFINESEESLTTYNNHTNISIINEDLLFVKTEKIYLKNYL